MIGLSVPVAELLDYGAVFLGTDAGLPTSWVSRARISSGSTR
ncbi:MAG TPA: hypothetical protein O0X23_01585 [Methanocorpusculum sp.]|nr:hypothetical protein [Methanocorpusculum sp.]